MMHTNTWAVDFHFTLTRWVWYAQAHTVVLDGVWIYLLIGSVKKLHKIYVITLLLRYKSISFPPECAMYTCHLVNFTVSFYIAAYNANSVIPSIERNQALAFSMFSFILQNATKP